MRLASERAMCYNCFCRPSMRMKQRVFPERECVNGDSLSELPPVGELIEEKALQEIVSAARVRSMRPGAVFSLIRGTACIVRSAPCRYQVCRLGDKLSI